MIHFAKTQTFKNSFKLLHEYVLSTISCLLKNRPTLFFVLLQTCNNRHSRVTPKSTSFSLYHDLGNKRNKKKWNRGCSSSLPTKKAKFTSKKWISVEWFKLLMTLWRICPTTVSLLLKPETIKINQKFKFLMKVVKSMYLELLEVLEKKISRTKGNVIKIHSFWHLLSNFEIPLFD